VALLLRVFVVEAFKIPSGSMIPTLEIGDHIFVNKFNFGIAIPWFGRQLRIIDFAPPTPGDVIVFISPPAADNAGEDFIKRVVAGPGQEIRLVDGQLIIDGKEQPRQNGGAYMYEDVDEQQGRLHRRNVVRYIEEVNGVKHAILLESVHGNNWPRGYRDLHGLECTEDSCRVKPGFVFCMGDNRDKSSDSRFWGAVPVQNIKGKAMFVWMSFGGHAIDAGFLGVRWKRLGTWIE
jgi:signal peptidase I